MRVLILWPNLSDLARIGPKSRILATDVNRACANIRVQADKSQLSSTERRGDFSDIGDADVHDAKRVIAVFQTDGVLVRHENHHDFSRNTRTPEIPEIVLPECATNLTVALFLPWVISGDSG